MKIKCIIRAVVEREVEVDDKFLPLCDDNFWANNNREANQLSKNLKTEVEYNKLLDNEMEVMYILDTNDNILFE